MEQYYVLDKFAEMERSLTDIIQTMPIKRRALDIYKERDNIQRAKEMFSDLETIKGELIDTVRNLGLLFLEYEMISGHRRKRASEFARKTHIPCIIRNLNDDEAAIALVDSNLQRECILPSERAFAYKLKYDAKKGKEKGQT